MVEREDRKGYKWRPRYTEGRKGFNVNFEIDDCPRSYVTPESSTLMQILTSMKHVRSFSGASVGRYADLSARQADAIKVMEICRIEVHNAGVNAPNPK
jgi:hypothetical protein